MSVGGDRQSVGRQCMRPGCEWSTRGLVCGGNRNTHSHTPIPSLPQALLCLASFHQLWEQSINSSPIRAFFFFFWLHRSLQILVPQPGIKPTPPAVGTRCPMPWATGKPLSPTVFVGKQAPGGEAGGPSSRAPHQLQRPHPPPGARRRCVTWEDRRCLPAPLGWW